MPNWKKLVISGSDASLKSITVTNGVTGSLSGTAATASFTPNALVTASVSLNTLTFTKGNGSTFNLTVDTGSGGAPGGGNESIQYNNGIGGFAGSNKLLYNDTDARLSFQPSDNFVTNPYDNTGRSSIIIINDPLGTKQNPRLTFFTYIAAPNTQTVVMKFTALNAGVLKILGFTCDYNLFTNDGGSYETRTGTLTCALTNDPGNNPAIADVSISGIAGGLLLSSAVFSMDWDTDDIRLILDCTSINNDTKFAGSFTIFTSNV